MNDEIETMARDFYGFGNWNAPYWFIGPEPGGSNNEVRAKAFKELGCDGLCDCKRFHEEIEVLDWHHNRNYYGTPKLQSTWRRLILLLMAYLNEYADNYFPDDEKLRIYQRDHWGRSNGDSCVIELAGLSSKNEAESTHTNRDINQKYLVGRISKIRNRMQSSSKTLQLVVVYGKAGQKDWTQAKMQWEKITGHALEFKHAVKSDNTVYVFTPHPQAHEYKDEDWADWVKNVENKR